MASISWQRAPLGDRGRVPIEPIMGIDNVLTKPIEAGLIPGVVALAADDRGVFYEGAFGWRAIDRPEPMTLDSVFRIASMTKAVTGTAAMQLVELGRCDSRRPSSAVGPCLARGGGIDECTLSGVRRDKAACSR